MTKITMAWYAQGLEDTINEEGTFGEESEQRIAEIKALREMGAPETENIEIVSITPEDREDAIVEALVTLAFAEWAKEPSELHGTRLPLLD